ncbi:MAG: protein-glutamate O-methyltransferase CheR, partial [Proteobacteria bacterium]|nr:protein-glutamate O-methyltransferase CheR [Pseudomonadota bacterium]
MNTALQAQPQTDLEASFTTRDFKFFAKLVYAQSGIVLADHKKNMMFSRLVRRVRELGLSSFKDYAAYVKGPQGESEIGALINAMTTNLTRFFREEHHFEFLQRHVFPAAVNRAKASGSKRLRIWSAGCSSGEEPYSIAMTVLRHFPGRADWDIKILATDLDTNMVARGAAGLYPLAAFEGMSRDMMNRYFAPVEGDKARMMADDALKALITFRPLNLLGPWPMRGPFDAIFCRNVMIYFDAPTKGKL